MSRPAVEVADILRKQGDRFVEQSPWLNYQQLTVLRVIARCRTAELGGHIDTCSRCDYQAVSYNSCRNRHCMKCQAQARERWLAARQREVLEVPYFHVVFTLPHELKVLCQRNARLLYDLLFSASRCHHVGGGSEPQTPGCADWLYQHSAYLGSEPAASSSHSLRCARWWILASLLRMDSAQVRLLLAC